MADPSSSFLRLDGDSARPEFCCGDEDIDEFFHKDSIDGSNELLCVTYVLMQGDKAVAFFSVSNDSLKKEDCPRSARDRLWSVLPSRKRYRSMPAVKIGRLGVCRDAQRGGLGTAMLDAIKVSFTQGNKTGCRYLLVDAYNQAHVVNFYQRNGFLFLTSKDEKEETRIMYFDLITFVNAAKAAE